MKLTKKVKNLLWNRSESEKLKKQSDDYVFHFVRLSDLYKDVPEGLDVLVEEIKFHRIHAPGATKKKVMDWLNERYVD